MTETLPTINASELFEWIENGDPLALLDVREPFERDYCSIRVPDHVFDIHIPLNSISQRLEELRGLTHNLPIVVYCHHGIRSEAAGLWLAKQGIANVFNLAGGIDAWSLRVDPSTPRY